MKRVFKVIISLALLMITCIVLSILLMYARGPKGKPIPTTEEKIKQLNLYVNNSLVASKDNMYMQLKSSHELITVEEYPELEGMVYDLNRSIKVKEEYKTDTSQFLQLYEACLRWKDVEIYIDINSDAPNNQLYIMNKAQYYKAEASVSSIQEITEFAAKFK